VGLTFSFYCGLGTLRLPTHFTLRTRHSRAGGNPLLSPWPCQKNQYPDLVERLAPQIATVKEDLRAGRLPSDIANALRASGLLNIHLMVICLQATGASIAELKAFDRWWGPQGVTDASAFNAWAAHVFKS
jgi:hypothetical protein